METTNSERISVAYEAFVRGDVEPMVEMLDPDVEWHNPEEAVEPGIRRGREAFRGILEELQGTFEYSEARVERMVESDTEVALIVRVRGEGRLSGTPIEQRFGHLLTVRDGRVVRFEWFTDPEAAIAALQRTGTASAES